MLVRFFDRRLIAAFSIFALVVAICASSQPIAFASSGSGNRARRNNAASSGEKVARSVTIYRDEYGVPHVYGPTDASCVFGYIYAQAEDNFWQIEDSYIRSLGRSSEVYGERTLSDDLLNRALEIPNLSKAEYARSSARTKELCDAVAAGLNFFLARNPQVKPRLITHFEPWYMFAFNRFALYQLFIFGKSGLKAGEIRGAVTQVGGDTTPASSTSGSSMAEAAETIEEIAGLEPVIGSNMWAIVPQKTSTGHAMLFINPHQPFFGPGQWYEGHVHSDEGWDMTGASFFGSGFPTIGHNEFLGWSHTVNDPDITDLYAEKFDDSANPLSYRFGATHKLATEWTDIIKVKTDSGVETKTFKFRKTHHGPIVSIRNGQPLALKMSRLEEGGMIDEWYAMSKSRSMAEFKAAIAQGAIPMFNAIYADRDGNIFYIYNGAVPRRSEKFDWTKPVDGSDPETEWHGYHQMADLPQLTNPKTGFLQNCNQTPFTTTSENNPEKSKFPSYMVRESDNARARISRRILSRSDRFSFDDWTHAGLDTYVIESETQIPELAAEIEKLKQKDPTRAEKLAGPISELQSWNHISSIDSKAMTLFALWYEKLGRLKGGGDKDPLLAIKALEEVMADLERDFGSWQVAWGEINRLQRIQSGGELETFSDSKPSLPIAGAPGWVGIVNNFYTRPVKGQKRRYGVAGTSFVSVVEFGPKVQARSLLVFGEDADPKSSHNFDQARLYSKRQFKTAWYYLDEIKAHSTSIYHPGEGAAKPSASPAAKTASKKKAA
jgi:acyl-homoserine-lactone acylase